MSKSFFVLEFVVNIHSISGCKVYYIAQKMRFSIKDFFSKCDQVRSFLLIWPHLLKKSLMENFIFSAVLVYHKTLTVYSILVVFISDVLPVFSKLEFQYNYFCLSHFAPIISKSSTQKQKIKWKQCCHGNNQSSIYERFQRYKLFHKNFKNQEKEAGTNFVLLSQSRNTIGWFRKAYLYRPIEIL